ncbi:MAG: GNAT family N-acetyltransferase [Planctomycetaceae bacterium]|jgi:ribosomal protein S18 acetylase RimI-like enzyme|nr:GNAT family N-acetyltransferase [Planctomycetaceae bacterium]
MLNKIHIEKVDRNIPKEVYIQVANIHKAEISSGFLSTLSLNFLARLYRALADSPYSFLFIAKDSQNTVVGFICGGINTKKVIKRFLFRNAILSFPYLIHRLFSIKTIKKIFETLSYPSKENNSNLPEPEILNFCVSSKTQRLGIGKKFFYTLIEEFQKQGIAKIKIVTGENQVKAQRFYENNNAIKVQETEIHQGIKSFIYIYNIEINSQYNQ